MTYKTLSRNERIVVAIAKLPLRMFGPASTKEVALVLAKSLNSAQKGSVVLQVDAIAVKACCSPRIVQCALTQLEEMGLFKLIRSEYGITPQFLGIRHLNPVPN